MRREKSALKRTKGDIALEVLTHISEGVGDFAELFMAIAEAGYGASSRRIEWVREQNRATRRAAEEKLADEQEARRKYKKLLSALKKDGLVTQTEERKLLKLTRKGMAKLATLRERKRKMMPPIAYDAKPSGTFTIVAFDVPERERRKRDWLREVLAHNGFTCIQKSVWMGKVTIPRELLDDIRRLRLASFVEIFQITKRGTLQQIE